MNLQRVKKKECSAVFLSYWPSSAPHLPIINSGQTFSTSGAKEKNNYCVTLREVINVNPLFNGMVFKQWKCVYIFCGNRQHLMNILFPTCTDVFHHATWCVGAALSFPVFIFAEKFTNIL